MKLNERSREQVHTWVAEELPSITSEDPDSLSSFIVSLLEADAETREPDEQLAASLREALNEFLADATESFVAALLQFVEAVAAAQTDEPDAAATAAPAVAPAAAASRDGGAAAAAALPAMDPLPAATPAASSSHSARAAAQQQSSSDRQRNSGGGSQALLQAESMESDISSRSRRGDDDDEHEAGQKRKRDDESAQMDPLTDTTDAQAAKRARGAAAAAAAGGSAGAAATAAGRNGRPSKPCFDFQRFGNCRRGASCFFEHVPRDQQAQSSQQQQPQLGHFPLPGLQPQWLPPGGMLSSMQRQQQMMAMQMQQQMQQQQMIMQQQQQQQPPQSHALHTIRVMDDDETEIPLTGRGAHVTAAASHGLLDSGRGGSFMGRGGGRGGRGGLGFIQQRGGMVPPAGSGASVPFSYANSSAAPAQPQSQQRFVSASSAEMPASSADHAADAERKDVSTEASGAEQQATQQRDNSGEEATDVGGDEEDGPPILSNEEYMASLAARGTFDRAARGGRGGARGGARGGGRGGARGGFGGFDAGVNGGGGGNDHSCKLFLTRVPAELNSLVALAPHFAQFGEIVSIKIVGEDRALVQMGSHAEALAALNSPQAVLGNRFIQVEWARHDGGGSANVAHGAGQSHQREFKQRQPHFHASQQFVRAQQQQQQSDPHSVAPPPPAAPLSAIDVAKALAKTNAASAASSQSESESASSAPAAAVGAASAESKMAALKALLLQKQLATQKELLAKLTAPNSTLTTAEKQALMKRIAALNDEIKGAKAGTSAAHKPAAAAAATAPPAKLSALEVVARMKAAKAAAAVAAAAASAEPQE